MKLEDVRIYKLSIKLESELFQILDSISKGWSIDQVKQAKRSSSSVSANICEGFSRRYYPKDYSRFLCISMGSSDETQHHLMVLHNKKHIDEHAYKHYSREYKYLSIKILNLINWIRNNSKSIDFQKPIHRYSNEKR